MAFGDYGQYWGDKKQALLTRDPSVLSYEEGEQPDTVFMRSDSIFIYTLNRFRNDSVPTQKTADSLAAETPAPFPAADSAAVRPATNGPGRPPIPTLPDGQAPPPASAPAPPPVPAGNDTETPADSAQRNIPGETADSLAQSEPPVPDSVSMSDSVRKAKERPVDPKKLEKERLRKEKEKARTAKIKAKIKASREKAAAIARAQQEQEWARQRKELARRFLKGKATSEDTLALLKLDSLQQVFAADTLAASPDSTVQKAPSPAPAADSATVKAAADSAAIVDPADSLVRIVRGYYNVRIYRSDFQAVCDSIVGFSIDSTIHMYTNPVLWNGENQITAQTVDIFTKNQTIEKAVFRGEPLMCSRVDSTHFNQVKGKVIETYFNNGEIFKTDVNGNGQTYYYMEDGDSTDRYISGFLVAECADITFRFTERQVSEIVYRGNPSYSIYPMDKIAETQSQLMKGFKWEIERKPTKEQVFTRTIRPSQRARYETLSKPTYPITGRIDKQRTELPKSGWIDRTDRYLSQEALEFVRSLGN